MQTRNSFVKLVSRKVFQNSASGPNVWTASDGITLDFNQKSSRFYAGENAFDGRAQNAAPAGSGHAFSVGAGQGLWIAYQQFHTDLQNGVSAYQLQDDLVGYYNAQIGERGYATLAAQVAGNSGYNGQVPNQQLEAAFGDAGWGQNELKVAEQLATDDFNKITDNGSLNPFTGAALYVPTIATDVAEHYDVFAQYPQIGALEAWGGTPSAYFNQNWMGSVAFSYELTDVSHQSAALGTVSDTQLAISTDNLVAAGVLTFLYNPQNAFSNLAAVTGDIPTLSGIFLAESGKSKIDNAQALYGITLSNPTGDQVAASVNVAKVDSVTKENFGGGSIPTVDLNFTTNGGMLTDYQGSDGSNLCEIFGAGQIFSSPSNATIDVFSDDATVTGNGCSTDLFGQLTTFNLSGTNDSITDTVGGATVNLGAGSSAYFRLRTHCHDHGASD